MYCWAVNSCFVGGTISAQKGSTVMNQAELYVTTNGGGTWSSVLATPLTTDFPAFTDMACMSTTSCVVVGSDQGQSAGTTPADLAFLTNDAGATWTPITVPSASTTYGLYGIACNTTTHCLATGVSSIANNPLGGASLVALAFSAAGTASSTLEGVTISGLGGADGVDSVIQAQYGVTPVGSLTGAFDYFDAALSQGNSFSSVKVKVCNAAVTSTSSVSWWNPSANAGAGGSGLSFFKTLGGRSHEAQRSGSSPV